MKYIKTQDNIWIRTCHIGKIFIEELAIRRIFEVRVTMLGHLYGIKQFPNRPEAEEYAETIAKEME